MVKRRTCALPGCDNEAMWCSWCAIHCDGSENHDLAEGYVYDIDEDGD